MLPARGAAKVTQMVVLNNPNKVGLMHSFSSVRRVTRQSSVTFSAQQKINPFKCRFLS